MHSARRSLTASLGSWRVQLAYDPRTRARAEAAPVIPAPGLAWALLPAFVGAGASVAAACLALAHFLNLPGVARVLVILTVVAVVVAYGARCAPLTWGRVCGAARWPLAVVLAVCALSLSWSEPFASLMNGEPNVQAATFIGFVTLLSVLLIGSRSGGRIVPVGAPLVPGLSLLGLLCLVAVDGFTQVCFLAWAGAALYLLCYDRFLRRVAPDLSSGVPLLTWDAPPPRRGDTPAWALQSVLVSSVWFALFLGGGALLYWPVQALLPDLASFTWSHGPQHENARPLDYGGGAPVMEMRGGPHALSDKPALRVTVRQGTDSGLWRGRVYERYDQSSWSERSQLRELLRSDTQESERPFRLATPRGLDPLRPIVPRLSARQGQVAEVLELVEPLGRTPNLIYSSGQPLSCQPLPDEFDATDPSHTTDLGGPVTPYLVRSFVTQPNLRALSQAPGFDARRSGQTAPSRAQQENLLLNLQLPDVASTRTLLKAVAYQIGHSGMPLHTPDQKIRAISSYLSANCLYSLQAPAVPPTQDATAFFLSQSREGACDMFASSMALLAREMKVPTRVVSGYLGAEDGALQSETDGRTTYTLRERDAHAWVEYYVPQFGWLTFDPTQNTREAAPSLPGQLARMLDFSRRQLPPALLVLPLLGLGLLMAGVFWHRSSPSSRAHATERSHIEAAYLRSLGALRARVPHAPQLTPGEYEARVLRAPLSDTVKQEFAALTHLYLAARYGPTPAVPHTQVAACLARLKKALKER